MLSERTPGRSGCRAVFVALLPAAVVFFAASILVAATSQTPTVDQLVAQADAHVKEGALFDAITALGKAVDLAPDRLDLRIRLAGLLKQRGMWERSAEQYRAVLAADPGNIPARLSYGELLLAEYQFSAAEKEFRRVLDSKAEPRDRDRALVGLGNAQFGLEQYQDAIDTYNLLLARKPDEPTALAFRSIAQSKVGDIDAAIGGWQKFLERQPGTIRATTHVVELQELKGRIARQKADAQAHPADAATQARLGSLLLQQPDYEGAARAFRAAVAADPGRADYVLKVGVSLREAGRFQEAAAEFGRISGDREWGAIAGYNLAWCARRLGDARREAAAWRAVLESHPRDPFAYRRYLSALGQAGGGDAEIESLVAAIKERPGDPLPRIEYGVVCRMIDRGDEGIRALLDALTLEPNDPYAQSELRTSLSIKHATLDRWIKEIDPSGGADPALASLRKGALLTSAGRFKEAQEPLSAAASRRPADARILVALALARRQSGADGEQAISDLRRARDLDPNYLYARLDLSMQLQARSAFDDAIAEAEAALRLAPDHPVALTILGASFRARGNADDLGKARLALRRAVQVEPMESSGAARFLLSKVEWELGLEEEARETLRGYVPVDPDEMYRVAWESVRDNYKDRTFNGQDWNAWRDRFAGALRTKADALGAIAQMLASLDDRDTRLRSADQTSSMFFTPRSTNVERDSIGRTRAGSKTVASASLPGNVGYVAVTNMSDPKLVKEVRSAVEGMKDSDGLILDLRGNPGGAEEEAQAIASMLVPPGVATGVVVSPAGNQVEKSKGVEPPIIPDAPVVVLVDRNTGSSAEALAGSLKESKRAIIVGEHTYGKAGIQLPRLLPDGTILLVAGGENASLAGKSYTAVGVKPDVSLESAMPAADPNGDEALQKAKEILTREQLRRKGAAEGKPKP